MVLNASRPNDGTLYSEMDDYQRETREAVNDLGSTISGEVTGVQTINSVTTESIEAGTQMHELYLINGSFTLSYINGANEGHIVWIKVRSGSSLTVKHSEAQTNGDIFLNGTGENLSMSGYDMLALVNINGDQSAGNDGYWEELERSIWA